MSGRRQRDESGFSIVEMMVSLAVLSVVIVLFATQLSTSYRVYISAKDRTLAEQIATSMIESARGIAYDDLGTTPGNPVGSIPRNQTINREGLDFDVTTTVEYVDDPLPGGFRTKTNYKQMRVKVARLGTTIVDMQTRMPPSVKPSLTRGAIEVRIIDYALNLPISGAEVTVSGGPPPIVSDFANAAGEVRFAGLRPTTAAPTNNYIVTVAAAGYVTVPADRPPAAATTNPLVASQTWTTVLRMFKTVTITPRLVFTDGTPFPYPATVEVTSPRGSETIAVTKTATLSTVAGVPIYPSESYTLSATATALGVPLTSPKQTMTVPTNYPSILDREFVLVMPDLPSRAVTIRTVDSTGATMGNIAFTVTGGDRGLNRAGTTDANGTSVVQLPQSNAPYTVTVPAAGVVPATVTQNVTVGTTPVTAQLTVLPVPDIRIYLTKADGNPAPGVTVTVTGGDRAIERSGVVAANGVATIAIPVSTAPYRISVPASVHGPGSSQLFTVTGAATYDIYVADPVRFIVRDQAASALGNMRVEVSGGDLAIAVWALTDDAGAVSIALPDSTTPYTLTIPAGPNTKRSSQNFSVPPRTDVAVTLEAA